MELSPTGRWAGLVIALALIIGAIVFIESGKASPGIAGEGSDISVADIAPKAQGDEIAGSVATETSTMTDTKSVEPSAAKTAEQEAADRIAAKAKKYSPAKELVDPAGFINTDPFKIADLIGKKVILIDFWTYSCINCQRTLPFVTSWYTKYKDKGLVIIGVHTPEFDFEKDYDNVKRATEKYGVTYPVVLDNNYGTWRAYKNQYWPREYLIDIDGFIVHDHIGEGGYDETEAEIVKLLNERSQVLGKETVPMDTTPIAGMEATDFSKIASPETYVGGNRLGAIANLPSTSCLPAASSDTAQAGIGTSCDFTTDGNIKFNTFAFKGTWMIGPEYTTLQSDTGSIFYHFSANKVNLVAGSETGVRAEIYLDGEKVTSTNAGSNVTDGQVLFKDHDLYNLIDLHGDYGEHTLEIRFLDSGVEAFAFTFG